MPHASIPRPPPHPVLSTSGESGSILVCPRRQRDRLVLSVVGEADLSTAAQLRSQLLASLAFAPTSLIVDLSGLGFCDLAGLDALHDLIDAAAARHVPVRLTGMSRQLSLLHRTFPRRPPAPSTDRPPLGGRSGLVAAVAGGQPAAAGDMIHISRTTPGEDG